MVMWVPDILSSFSSLPFRTKGKGLFVFSLGENYEVAYILLNQNFIISVNYFSGSIL